MFPVEVTETQGTDRFGKEMSCYVAKIKGPGTRFALERAFLKQRPENGTLTLPNKPGVYEVRDWPNGIKRVRYYSVTVSGSHLLMVDDDEDVLDAVSRVQVGDPIDDLWMDVTGAPARAVTLDEVIIAVDEATQSLVEALEGGELDQEDIGMAMDKIKQYVEAAMA